LQKWPLRAKNASQAIRTGEHECQAYTIDRNENNHRAQGMGLIPGETFRVLKEKEEKQFGEYRTRRRGELVTFPIIEGGRDAFKGNRNRVNGGIQGHNCL
jgi:hypothetical protein